MKVAWQKRTMIRLEVGTRSDGQPDGCSWPYPSATYDEVRHRLRYGTPSRSDLYIAAEVMDAWHSAITHPARTLRSLMRIVSAIRRHYREQEAGEPVPSPSALEPPTPYDLARAFRHSPVCLCIAPLDHLSRGAAWDQCHRCGGSTLGQYAPDPPGSREERAGQIIRHYGRAGGRPVG